jgi:hypothetical protein
MEFNPYEDPARKELVRILEACNISSDDRIILSVDCVNDQPVIEIQRLSYPLGRFFKSLATWRTERIYRAATYDRLLTAIKSNPEWLTFHTYFEVYSKA